VTISALDEDIQVIVKGDYFMGRDVRKQYLGQVVR